MAIKSGRVGVRHDQVDHYGRIKNVAGGIFSNVSAGSLVSSASAENSKLNTPSSFTGKIDLTSIKGNTIKWNQHVRNGNFADANSWDKYSSTLSVSNNIGIITATASSGNIYTPTSLRFSPSNGDKVLVCGKLKAGTSNARLRSNIGGTVNVIDNTTTTWQTFANIVTAGSSGVGYIEMFAFDSGTAEYKDIMAVNLTQMFGAGNEPTTVEQFKSMFPLDYYEYDAGSLLSFNANILQNALTGEEIYLPTLTYFPTGMKSAGNVYDELIPSKATTRIGFVDLGTLNWSYASDEGHLRFSSEIISDSKVPASGNVSANIICSNYQTKTESAVYGNTGVGISLTTSGRLMVYDSSFTDATAFKSAMSGVMLYYELATPIETDVDVDFNLSLNVNEGENLQLLPLGTDTPASAPLRATVTSYKSGTTGNDVEKLLGSIAQIETSPATTNHAEGDYIMYNYQLYKVTASITTGASLVVGTNITATTVMDEFKTL